MSPAFANLVDLPAGYRNNKSTSLGFNKLISISSQDIKYGNLCIDRGVRVLTSFNQLKKRSVFLAQNEGCILEF